MKSTDIYKTLNSYLKHPLKELGYKKVKFSRLGWYKGFGLNYIIIQFQCNKWGWNYWTGTDIKLYLGLYSKITEASWSVKPVILLDQLLDDTDLLKLVEIQNAVIHKFHKSEQNYKDLHPAADPAFLGFLENQFEPIEFPPIRFDQERMRIYDESDICNWGEFFQQRIKKISDNLEIIWQESN